MSSKLSSTTVSHLLTNTLIQVSATLETTLQGCYTFSFPVNSVNSRTVCVIPEDKVTSLRPTVLHAHTALFSSENSLPACTSHFSWPMAKRAFQCMSVMFSTVWFHMVTQRIPQCVILCETLHFKVIKQLKKRDRQISPWKLPFPFTTNWDSFDSSSHIQCI